MTRQFVIDTDTASDDAVALLMALRRPDVDVKAITVVAGNVGVAQGTRNALYTAQLCDADVPVYQGADRPLVREHMNAHWFHGEDGMGDQHYPAPERDPAPGHAVDALIDTIRAHPGLTLVTLGPLTNLALALRKAPDIVEQVGRYVMMGGTGCTHGNVTPAAEYNVWVDPEAARIVFHAGLPLEMVGWELCLGPYALTMDEIEQVRQIGTSYAAFAIDCNRTAIQAYHRQTGEHGLSLPDPVAMAVTLEPGVCTHSDLHSVDVETDSELTRGMTVVDKLGVADDPRNQAVWARLLRQGPNARVCWEVDAAGWKAVLYRALHD